MFKQKVLEARGRLVDTTSEEVDSGIIRSEDMDGGGRMMDKRLGGKFLAPLTGVVGRPMGTILPSAGESKPIGRVDQIRRQFDVQKVLESGDEMDARKPPIKGGFTLTGTGSMFLKSTATGTTAKKTNAEDYQPKSLINSETPAVPLQPSVKGILRDSSLTDVHTRNRNSESGELEKSVRFSLFGQSTSADNNDELPINSPANPIPRPSSALNKNLKLNSDSDATSTDEDDFEEEVIEEVENGDEDAWTPRRPCEIKVITSAKQPITSTAEGGVEQPEMNFQTVDLQPEIQSQVEKLKMLENESNRFDAEIKRIREMNEEKLQQFMADEEQKLQRLLEAKREEMEIDKQSSLTVIESQLEAKIQSVRAEIEESYSLDTFRNELNQEFEMKRRTIVDEHRSAVGVLERNHQEILEDLERDLKLQEALIRKEHSTKKAELRSELTHELETERIKMRESGEDRMYEKMRCEKRLLEDKYRCLKDRYNRLKTDVKLSVEKRNNRRRDQQQQPNIDADKRIEVGSNNGHRLLEKKNSSTSEKPNKPLGHTNRANVHQHTEDTTSISISDTTMSHTHPRMNYSAPLVVDDLDSEAFFVKSDNQRHSTPNNNNQKAPHSHRIEADSPDQHSPRGKKKLYSRTKSASTSRLHSSKLAPTTDLCGQPCTPIENLRRQLKKLEDLEDQFPDNTLEATYHLRYPFGLDTATTNYENTSSELEFFKHRIHLERDALSRAKANLKSQRDNFRAKREKLLHHHHTVEELMGEEKEITEMEVNLHRTRALLGEKVIRLRHLEQSLQRYMEQKNDAATLSDLSSHSSSGFSSTDFVLSGDAANSNKNRNRMAPITVESTTDILKNLETLNSEIREIWEILKQTTTTSGSANYYSSELDWSFNANTPHLPLTPNPLLQEHNALLRNSGTGGGGLNRNFTSLVSQSPMAGQYTSTLVERTRDLRNWLRQAKQEHLMAQKHTQI